MPVTLANQTPKKHSIPLRRALENGLLLWWLLKQTEGGQAEWTPCGAGDLVPGWCPAGLPPGGMVGTPLNMAACLFPVLGG